MSSQAVFQVLVTLFSLQSSFASAQMYMYSQPYPYSQQYNYPSYGGIGSYPGPYQPIYPNYGQQFAAPYPSMPYPSYPASSVPEIPQYSPPQGPGFGGGYGGGYVGGYGGMPPAPVGEYPTAYSQQGGVYSRNMPFLPQSVMTPYGSVPVEIIDVNSETGEPEEIPKSRQPLEVNSTSTAGGTKINTDGVSKPVKTSSILRSPLEETKIVRTLDSRGVKVEVLTNKPPLTKNDSDEENETTTKKYSFFG